MMTIAEQDALSPITPLGPRSPASSEPQTPESMERVTTHNSEALELALIIGVATFNHR